MAAFSSRPRPLFEKQLPAVSEESSNTVIVLNLRGYEDLGSTFLTVLERYSADLREHHSKLMLAGVHASVVDQLEKTGLLKKIGRENIFWIRSRSANRCWRPGMRPRSGWPPADIRPDNRTGPLKGLKWWVKGDGEEVV